MLYCFKYSLFALAKSTFHFQAKAFNAKIEYNCKEGNLTCVESGIHRGKKTDCIIIPRG